MFLVNSSLSLPQAKLGVMREALHCDRRNLVGIFPAHANTGVGILSVRKLRTIMLDVNHLASVTRNEAGSTSPGSWLMLV